MAAKKSANSTAAQTFLHDQVKDETQEMSTSATLVAPDLPPARRRAALTDRVEEPA